MSELCFNSQGATTSNGKHTHTVGLDPGQICGCHTDKHNQRWVFWPRENQNKTKLQGQDRQHSKGVQDNDWCVLYLTGLVLPAAEHTSYSEVALC